MNYAAYLNVNTKELRVLEAKERDLHHFKIIGEFKAYSSEEDCIRDMFLEEQYLSCSLEDNLLKRIIKKQYPELC